MPHSPQLTVANQASVRLAKLPTAFNLCLAVACVALNLHHFFFLPLLLKGNLWWALTLIPLAVLTSSQWALLHEGFHGLLHPSKRVNSYLSRLLSIMFGFPHRVLRTSHLMHHKYNRTLDQAEAYRPGQGRWFLAALSYYFRLFGGLYVSIFIFSAMFLLPRCMAQRALSITAGDGFSAEIAKALSQSAAKRETRLDFILAVAFLAVSAWAYGRYWWCLLVLLSGRAFFFSFLDYLYHYGSQLGDTSHAYNLRLPRAFSRLVLHFNFHAVHHANPSLPWICLPREFAHRRMEFDGGYLEAAFAQLKGLIRITELRVASRRYTPHTKITGVAMAQRR